jgi:hypothetical protein
MMTLSLELKNFALKMEASCSCKNVDIHLHCIMTLVTENVSLQEPEIKT